MAVLSFTHHDYYLNSKKTIYFLSKSYIKNRASLGFLFFAGKNYFGQQFSNFLIIMKTVLLFLSSTQTYRKDSCLAVTKFY